MPAYATLFDGAPDSPRQDARDLVAYIESLGRARELAWPEGDAAAEAAAPDDAWTRKAFNAPLLNAHPGRARARGEAPAIAEVAASDASRALWHDHCAGCHGEGGRGDGPAAQWLLPAPPDLSQRDYTLERLSDVLWNGVAGTSMPAWRDHSAQNLAELAAIVRAFYVPAPEAAVTSQQIAAGALVYGEHCAECHGADGRGDGFAASQLPVAPTDFHGERPSLAESLNVLRNGIEGTSMAPWTDRLDDEEILAVAHFVRAFFDRNDAAGRNL